MVEMSERIKKVREDLGMSKAEFADLFKISAMTVARYEGGQSKPSKRFLADFHVLESATNSKKNAGEKLELKNLLMAAGGVATVASALPFIGGVVISPFALLATGLLSVKYLKKMFKGE